MIKRRILALVLSASALAANPAFAWRGGGFGGFHAGGFHGGFAGGDAWHAGGFHGYGGTWHADGYHAGGVWGGGYGYHGPAVVNSYYGGGCYACAGAAVGLAAAGAYAIGTSLATLPGNCSYRDVYGAAYYVCGNTWLNPQYGANGLYYQVIPPL
jgi:hypothetical protein